MKINSMTSKDCVEKQLMHSNSDDTEVLIGNNTDGVISRFFHSLLHRCQIGVEESVKGCDFVFDHVDGLH